MHAAGVTKLFVKKDLQLAHLSHLSPQVGGGEQNGGGAALSQRLHFITGWYTKYNMAVTLPTPHGHDGIKILPLRAVWNLGFCAQLIQMSHDQQHSQHFPAISVFRLVTLSLHI